MTDSEDRLAPVTYLFGSRAPDKNVPGNPAVENPMSDETPRAAVRARTPSGDAVGASDGARRVGAHPAGTRLPTLRSVYGDRYDARDDEDADDSQGVGVRDGDDDRESDSGDDDSADRMTPERIENISLHALGRKGLSRRELERTLRSRGVDDAAIEAEASRLESVGLIDDVALAQNLVGVLQERKGLGRTGVAAELAKRMLSPTAIEYALELVDTGDELARARELAAARARQLTRLDPETAKRRLSAYLARRGYSGSTVRAAVDAALQSPKAGATVRFR